MDSNMPKASIEPKNKPNKEDGIHPDLLAIFHRAQQMMKDEDQEDNEPADIEVFITHGLRTVEEQKGYVKSGRSRTMNSNHLPNKDGLATALDIAFLVDEKITWDWAPFIRFSKFMKKAAKELKLKVLWGGDWKKFPDGPHFELPAKYR